MNAASAIKIIRSAYQIRRPVIVADHTGWSRELSWRGVIRPEGGVR